MAVLTLIVGNGFSIGLAQHLNIAGRYRSSSGLIPANTGQSVELVRFDGSQLKPGPLWREDLFPELWKEWHSFEPTNTHNRQRFSNFCARLARTAAVELQGNKFSVESIRPGVQLRQYIWLFMVHYHNLFSQHWHDVESWPWTRLIRGWCEQHDFSVVSFNYDLIPELVLGKVGYACTFVPTAHPNCIRITKPHGSITHYVPCGYFLGVDGGIGRGNQFSLSNCQSEQFARFEWPPRGIPPVPNLVPPGHSCSHYVMLNDNPGEAVQKRFEQTEVLVACGLSADPPDDEEIEGYARHIRENARVIQIGVRNDDQNRLAKILQKRVRDYTYLDATDINKLFSMV